MRVQGCFQSPGGLTSLRISLIELFLSRVALCSLSGPFSYYRLDIPTQPSAAARDGNKVARRPSSTCTRYRESGKLLRFKGEELSYRLSPSLQECLSASVLSEFLLLPLNFPPFLQYLVIPFCAAKLAAVPACSQWSICSRSPPYMLIVSSQFWSL